MNGDRPKALAGIRPLVFVLVVLAGFACWLVIVVATWRWAW
jgi:hypothetical protein